MAGFFKEWNIKTATKTPKQRDAHFQACLSFVFLRRSENPRFSWEFPPLFRMSLLLFIFFCHLLLLLQGAQILRFHFNVTMKHPMVILVKSPILLCVHNKLPFNHLCSADYRTNMLIQMRKESLAAKISITHNQKAVCSLQRIIIFIRFSCVNKLHEKKPKKRFFIRICAVIFQLASGCRMLCSISYLIWIYYTMIGKSLTGLMCKITAVLNN